MVSHKFSNPTIKEVGSPDNDSTVFDDIKFPFFGRRIDTAAGHLDYDVTELGINFDDSSRYNDEDQVAIIAQIQHNWKQGSDLRPHIHWVQNQNAVPNILMKYRITENGGSVGSWNLVPINGSVFTYTSGTLMQISEFAHIDMSAIDSVSCIIDIKIYRDTANTSGEFAGADSYTGDALLKEFDFHYEKDMNGSRHEYIK